jgi:hypothetical protein
LREHFHHPQSAELIRELDRVAECQHSRERVFDDFLTLIVCALAGGTMEEEYLRTAAPYAAGDRPNRVIDVLTRLFGQLIEAMEETRADILGDIFQGAITRRQNGQFFTPRASANCWRG